MTMQQRLTIIGHERRKPFPTQLNYVRDGFQNFNLSEGCPHMCPYCYEHNQLIIYPVPEITHPIKILDMNFLWQPNAIERMRELRASMYSKITIEAVCGFDYRMLTPDIAQEIKKTRFRNPRIAWDWGIDQQYKEKDALKMLTNAGYNSKDIGIFMLANWRIPFNVCMAKLDLLKVWNVRVCDCCYDGGYDLAIPEYWTDKQIKYFRAKCALHNQLINFGIYPDIKRIIRLTVGAVSPELTGAVSSCEELTAP